MGNILEIENLEGVYDKTITALRNIDMTVEEGSITGIIGPNGAGKTDLLKFISGLAKRDRGEATRGSIVYKGENIENMDPNDVAAKGIIMTMEDRRVFEHLTVEENLKATPADDIEEVKRFFPDLKKVWNGIAGYISGGEQQMLVTAMSLLCDPELLLLDEPFMGLAPTVISSLSERIEKINKELDVTILMAGENAEIALPFTDYCYVMEDGQTVLEGPSEDLKEDERIEEYYLGKGEHRTFADTKYYRRRKRWYSKG